MNELPFDGSLEERFIAHRSPTSPKICQTNNRCCFAHHQMPKSYRQRPTEFSKQVERPVDPVQPYQPGRIALSG
jgi:hypothetical protein